MGMSVDMKRAMARAEALDAGLLATDPRLNGSVLVVHEDGSIFRVQDAFAVEWRDSEVDPRGWGTSEHPGVWVFVLSEHHQTLVFPKCEVRVECFGPRLRVETVS